MTSRTRTRAQHLLRGLVVTAIASASLSACGGDDSSATDKPVEASSSPTSSAPSPSETPTPTPSPTLRPLSRFEDEPTVKVARKWAIGVARATTANDKSAGAIKPFVTPTGLTRFQGYMAEDMGRLYPGPLPFTPVAVRDQGGSAVIPICVWVGGFTVDPKTKQPDKAPRIVAANLQMVRMAGKWKVDDMIFADFSCKKTPVKGRAF